MRIAPMLVVTILLSFLLGSIPGVGGSILDLPIDPNLKSSRSGEEVVQEDFPWLQFEFTKTILEKYSVQSVYHVRYHEVVDGSPKPAQVEEVIFLLKHSSAGRLPLSVRVWPKPDPQKSVESHLELLSSYQTQLNRRIALVRSYQKELDELSGAALEKKWFGMETILELAWQDAQLHSILARRGRVSLKAGSSLASHSMQELVPQAFSYGFAADTFHLGQMGERFIELKALLERSVKHIVAARKRGESGKRLSAGEWDEVLRQRYYAYSEFCCRYLEEYFKAYEEIAGAISE